MKYITPIVVNRHKEQYDVYIGRGTIYGNKNEIDLSRGINRTIAIEMYREDLYNALERGDITIDDILALSGKKLGCSCKPKCCHGDIIVEVFEEIVRGKN